MKEKLENLKKEWHCEVDIFFSGILVGILAHGYMMFNKLPNVDDYVSMFHYGLGYPLGRWLLALMGNFMFRIDGVYSLPFLNGIFFLFTLALSITIFLKPFPFKSRWTKRIFAALFVSFPTVTSTMGFMFTVPFYGLAVLFTAIAFYLALHYKWGFIISILLICCSLGIYQAYWCLAAGFLLLYLISLCMKDNCENKILISISVKSLISLLFSVILYLIINKIMLHIQGIQLSNYQGVSQMGQFSLSQIPTILKNAYGTFFKLTSENYLYITWYPIIRAIIAIGYIITVLFCGIACFQNRKNILKTLALIIFTILLPLTINSIYIMCNDASVIHILMCYSVVLVFLTPLVYIQGVISKCNKKTVFHGLKAFYLSALILVTYFYVRLANIYYLDLELAYNETYSFMNTLSTRIQETEGYTTDTPLYFHGLYPHAVNRSYWELRLVNNMHGTIDVDNVINSPLMRLNFSKFYLGQPFREVSDPDIYTKNASEIDNMPCYPDQGSIQFMNDIIIIKLSE